MYLYFPARHFLLWMIYEMVAHCTRAVINHYFKPKMQKVALCTLFLNFIWLCTVVMHACNNRTINYREFAWYIYLVIVRKHLNKAPSSNEWKTSVHCEINEWEMGNLIILHNTQCQSVLPGSAFYRKPWKESKSKTTHILWCSETTAVCAAALQKVLYQNK